MWINVKRNWFDPSGTMRESRLNPHEVPDSWNDVLPKGAEVINVENGRVLHTVVGSDPDAIAEAVKAEAAAKEKADKEAADAKTKK